MNQHQANLASDLNSALEAAQISLDDLAAHTKVPRASIHMLFGTGGLDLPQSRVYVRAHLRLIAEALEMDPKVALAGFDRAFPAEEMSSRPVELPRFSRSAVAAAAGLTGVGLLAIVASIIAG